MEGYNQVLGDLLKDKPATTYEAIHSFNSVISHEGAQNKKDWWHACTEMLLRVFYEGRNANDAQTVYHYTELEYPEEMEAPEYDYSACVRLNDFYEGKLCRNMTVLSFDNFYPRLIDRIHHTFDVEYSYVNFKDLYTRVLQEYGSVKAEYKALGAVTATKVWINMTYGMLGSKNPPMNVSKDVPGLVAQTGKRILENIIQRFSGHYVYADTDEIYFVNFNEISQRLNLYAYKTRLPAYSVDDAGTGVFFGRKKYIMFPNDKDVKFKGIREF